MQYIQDLEGVHVEIKISKMNKKIFIALSEAIWIMRWNKDKTVLKAVLMVEESEKICKNIVKKLDKAGFKIVSKNKK
jgi:hypothetical protein